jgi:predicted RNase H-like HicB family nuclease
MKKQTAASKPTDVAALYLKKPYARVLIYDQESGQYHAEILEFPGCFAVGSTPQEAYANLEEAASSWILGCLEVGQKIPEPEDFAGHSGRIALRIPRSLHRRVALFADREGISINQFLLNAISEKIGNKEAHAAAGQGIWLMTLPGYTAANDKNIKVYVSQGEKQGTSKDKLLN